ASSATIGIRRNAWPQCPSRLPPREQAPIHVGLRPVSRSEMRALDTEIDEGYGRRVDVGQQWTPVLHRNRGRFDAHRLQDRDFHEFEWNGYRHIEYAAFELEIAANIVVLGIDRDLLL